ncbi:MAG TPA: molybdopterin molybdotransferase MoeA [Thiobacillaceae bacterium]|nr:molybdopterin molybdotransferase MoeA [Thiobacillaceae bacterium]
MTDPSGCGGTETALSVAQARDILLSSVTAVEGWETVPIRAALGRVLMRDVIAPFDVPAHDNSAMDGYAARAEDLTGAENRLAVVGTAYAGGAFSGVVGPGQAVRVMTGAVLPRGADSVVVQEVAKMDGEGESMRVILPAVQKPGQNVRRAGEDLAAGKPALPAGKRIGPAELGLMASLGFAEVTVRRRPRVAFFSTGDELASIGRPLAPGEVYDSNRYTLFGALTQLGVDILDMGVVRDDPAVMEKAFAEAAAQADAILTTGGVSVGEADFVKDIMARLGEVRFWKIDIKPGRPMAFGRLGNAWLFGLPGNPVAVMVNFYQIVLDALVKLQGVDPLPPRPSFRVPSAAPIRKLSGRREFPRGVLFQEEGTWKVRLSGNQGSGVLRSMAEANCFIVLPEESGSVAAGDLVEVQPFQGAL